MFLFIDRQHLQVSIFWEGRGVHVRAHLVSKLLYKVPDSVLPLQNCMVFEIIKKKNPGPHCRTVVPNFCCILELTGELLKVMSPVYSRAWEKLPYSFSTYTAVTKSVSPEENLICRTSGPVPVLLNQNLHFEQNPWATCNNILWEALTYLKVNKNLKGWDIYI